MRPSDISVIRSGIETHLQQMTTFQKLFMIVMSWKNEAIKSSMKKGQTVEVRKAFLAAEPYRPTPPRDFIIR